ncbi:hypothetical protein [Hyalangium minutum]|uniref:Lipoprotein n=1 Tax=Hyalangium minutum TaxID=394096 RepID=A0A085VZA4_9BACT|nr:hypothetical protein [Hyalangium minutum]KFE60767.1 hypothetical protein DB31_4680 [Hyalangium minutum]
MRPLASLLLMMGWNVLGCASASLLPSNGASAGEAQDYGVLDNGFVWVRGPWGVIQPSGDIDEVIDQLCPAVMALPRADWKDYGQEYCGAIYTLGDGAFYASKPSPLGKTEAIGPAQRKNCYPPRYIVDERGRTSTQLDYHSHPWPGSRMSERDRQARTQIWPLRIQFDTRCTIQKLVPNLDTSLPGEVYERRGQSWVRVGIIPAEDKPFGYVTPLPEP